MAHVEIEQQISFFSFGFARVSEVRHISILVPLSYFWALHKQISILHDT